MKKNKRPRIKLKLNNADKAVEVIGWFSVFYLWYLVIANYNILPDIIPIHHNIAGEIDNFGEKSNILTLPLIATIFYIGLTVLNRFPHIFNYLDKITEKNALIQYTMATRMIRYSKLMFVFTFGLIVIETIQITTGKIFGLGKWFVPLSITLIFVPVIIYIIAVLTLKNKKNEENR